jgi:uncharacterized protein (TIGR03435 family)
MGRALTGVGFVVLLSCAVSGQSPQTTPAFDVADVHVRAHSTNPAPAMTGGVLRGGRYDLRNATMLDLISTAYGVDADTVLGGPNWLETDRFDLVAKAPQSTSPDAIKLMLQAMLADRFKLVVRKDTKPQPGFVLTTGTGKNKLKEASGDAAPGCQGQPQPQQPGVIAYIVVSCHNLTTEAIAQNLRNMAGGYLTSPVTDLTGLKGSWDFDLKWTGRGLLAQAGSDGISIFDAVDKQLGLKLESRQVPTPVLFVDSVNQKPTDNPSGVAQNLPLPPPAEFDVADIKLSMETMPMGRLQPGGRLDLQGFTLKMLMTLAWDINNDEMLAGAPKWLDETRYSLIARTSSVASGGAATGPQIDIDDVRLMLRALIVERFKLTTHTEERLVSAYTLVAAKPKLTKADPANRTGWKNGPAPNTKDTRDTNPILSRLVTCRNMSMAQLADDLQRIAPGYIHNPVVDATGLEGNWDFTFTFTPAGLVQGGPTPAGAAGQPAGATPAASDPNGAISLFDALNKQLGLKLEMVKRPMPVLVIDHVEEKPTDN